MPPIHTAQPRPPSSGEAGTIAPGIYTVLDSLLKHVALLDRTGRIVCVNRSWRDFGLANGATPEQANPVGLDYLSQCMGADDAPSDSDLQAIHVGVSGVLAGTSEQFEAEYPCHGPHDERWFLMRVTPWLRPEGGAVVTHDDITARWRLEQQRTGLVAELLSANRELKDFAHVVSHDLKAPLRGISSLANWLVTDHAEQLGDEGRAHLGLIASRVKRLSAMIDAILAYSRAGRAGSQRVAVALGPLVRNTIELLAPPPHISVEVEGELPALEIEAVKIQQVFQNLMSNAVDFMDKPAGRIIVRAHHEDDQWHFSVADNGPGIEARHCERVFQLFQTLSARDDVERTGVGLALVRKIVELEGGRAWIESEPGRGTTVHFTLPGDRPIQALLEEAA
jgi:signal transduction histidine kinase